MIPRLTKSQRREVMEHDLLRACIHEAAHHAVAAHFGIPSAVSVSPTGTRSPEVERCYVGQTQFFVRPVGEAAILIGLAGTVAEEMHKDASVDASEVRDSLAWGLIELSQTDADFAGDYLLEHLEEVLALLHQYWPDVIAEAERIVAEGRGDDGRPF